MKCEPNNKNPWCVENLEEFLYFCCPECDERNQSKESFIEHAFEQHPNSKECLVSFQFKEEFENLNQRQDLNSKEIPVEIYNVKQELIEDENLEDLENGYQMFQTEPENINNFLKCEISENISNDNSHGVHVKTLHKGNTNESLFANENEQKETTKNNIHREETKNETCDLCGKTLKSSNHLKRHIKRVHNENSEKFTCEICYQNFPNSHGYRRHMTSVHDIQPKCKQCNKTFKTFSSMDIHVKVIHEGIKDFQCEICSKKFGDLANFNRHKREVHEKLKNHVCDVCGKPYRSSNEVKNHKKWVHEGVKDYVCNFCGLPCTTVTSLQRHMKCVHKTGVKDKKCHLCDKSFYEKHRLNNHIKEVHENVRSKVCNICGKAFKKTSHLKTHINSVHEGHKLENISTS